MIIEELYKKVFRICVQFVIYQEKSTFESITDILPMINSFATWFLQNNTFDIEDEDYQMLQQLLINILDDLTGSLEQRDIVLLEDTVEFGLKEFLEMFVPDEQELYRLRELPVYFKE